VQNSAQAPIPPTGARTKGSNLSNYTRVELGLKLEPLLRVKAKANLVTSTGGSKPRPLQNSVKADTVNTQKELETASGISHDTISKGKVIAASEAIRMPLAAPWCHPGEAPA